LELAYLCSLGIEEYLVLEYRHAEYLRQKDPRKVHGRLFCSIGEYSLLSEGSNIDADLAF